MSMRTHYCGLTTEALLGQTVSLCGWVHRRRDHGGVIFIDLRDREGLVQIVCHPDQAEVFKAVEAVRNEYCLRITGTVNNRLEGTINAVHVYVLKGNGVVSAELIVSSAHCDAHK